MTACKLCSDYGERNAEIIISVIGSPDGTLTMTQKKLSSMLAAAWADGHKTASEPEQM